MKVKILKAIASKNYSYSAGTEVEMTKKQANTFIKAGIAESLETEDLTETENTTAPKTKETTSTRKGRKEDVDND